MKKKLKKKIIALILALTTIGFGSLALSPVFAQSNPNPASGLVSAIAQKFNLDQGQLQSFVTSYRQQNRQNKLQNHLDQLVTQGKITKDQETAILAEISSLKSKYNLNSLGTMSIQDRRQALTNAHNEFKTWTQSQGINLPLFGTRLGHFKRFGW